MKQLFQIVTLLSTLLTVVAQTKSTPAQLPTPGTSTGGYVWLVSPGGLQVWGVLDPATLEIDWNASPPLLKAKPVSGSLPILHDSVEINGHWTMPQGCAILMVFRALMQKEGVDYQIVSAPSAVVEQKLKFLYPVASSDPVRVLCFR